MSEKAEWRKRLLAKLGNLLAPYGFSSVAARRSYRKPLPAGWQSIHLALVQHPDDFDVVVDAGIRFDLVQKQTGGEADRRGHQATVGCEYGNLLGIGQYRWTVAAASDVTPVAHGILNACEDRLFPYIETYSDLAIVYEALKREGRFARLLMPLEGMRKAIVIAAGGLLK